MIIHFVFVFVFNLMHFAGRISLYPKHGANQTIFSKIYVKFAQHSNLLKVKLHFNFFNVLTLKISLIHKNSHICNVHTLEIFGSFYAAFPYQSKRII